MTELSVLIVSYRRADLLERCLLSVHTHLPHAAVLVWDNASDGSAAVAELADRSAAVRWTFSPGNVGFARAVNQLALQAGPGDLLLLNPDAELTSGLGPSQALLAADPRIAAAAPFVVDDERRSVWDNAHPPPTLLRHVISYAGYGSRWRGSARSDLYADPPGGPVGYLTGSCLLIRRSAWEQVGPLDERYFVYGEEVDWATRARRAGWTLRLAHERGARHCAGGTVADSPPDTRRSSALLREGQVRYLRDHHGRLAAWAFVAAGALLDRVQRSKRSRRAGP